MPRKNQQTEVCITAASVAMGGTFNIASTLAVNTKARLESIAVKGDCECDQERPPAIVVRAPTPVVVPKVGSITADIVFLVDRSESITQEIWETIKEFLGHTIEKLSCNEMNRSLDAAIEDVHIKSQWHFSVRGFGQNPDKERYMTGLMGEAARKKVLEWKHDTKDGTYTNLAIDTLCNEDIPNMMTRDTDIMAAVVVTDGLSKEPNKTKDSAKKLKDRVDLVFGVSIEGVSNYTADEHDRMKDEIQVISSEGCHLTLPWDNFNGRAEDEAEELARIMRTEIVKAKALGNTIKAKALK
jgi:hypothetical protein